LSYNDLINFLEQHLFACGIKQLTGFDCPGCGMQRAFIALLKGDLPASFAANPAMLPFLLTLVFTLLHLRFRFRHGAQVVLVLYCLCVSLMIVNYVCRSPLLRYL